MSSACGSSLTEKPPGLEEAAHYAVTLFLHLWSELESIYLEIFTFILALGFKLPSAEPVADLPAVKGCRPSRPLRPRQTSWL